MDGLVELEIVPLYVVDSVTSNIPVNWNGSTSITEYIHFFFIQYQQRARTSRALDDFITCLSEMSYTHSVDILLRAPFHGNSRGLFFMMGRNNIMRDDVRTNHNCMMDIERISTAIIEIFGGFSGLAVLGLFTLSQIVQMSGDCFERFAAFLRDDRV
ncbi:hypothetical protein EDC94DRAFT_622471 [Helicostylum pulchrum]|nr:hypothetical protein EDC94DRAFT_622471 [Helicostylum pulchrum]